MGTRDEPKKKEVRVPEVEEFKDEAPPPGLTKGEREKWKKE